MKVQEQTLWDRISQVADSMRDLPEWKRGSSLNERLDNSSSEQQQCRIGCAASGELS